MLLLFQWNRLPSDTFTIPDYLMPRIAVSFFIAELWLTYCSFAREIDPINIATRVSGRSLTPLAGSVCKWFIVSLLSRALDFQHNKFPTNHDETQIIDSLQSKCVLLFSFVSSSLFLLLLLLLVLVLLLPFSFVISRAAETIVLAISSPLWNADWWLVTTGKCISKIV